jgi:hypothetical protein
LCWAQSFLLPPASKVKDGWAKAVGHKKGGHQRCFEARLHGLG